MKFLSTKSSHSLNPPLSAAATETKPMLLDIILLYIYLTRIRMNKIYWLLNFDESESSAKHIMGNSSFGDQLIPVLTNHNVGHKL